MKKTTYVMSACAIIILASSLYYFLKEEPVQLKETTGTQKTEQATTLSYVGNSIVEEKDGKRQWELGAETIEIDVQSKNMILKNIKGIFYQDNGGKVEITAPTAVMESKTKNILMSGKVQAVASDGAAFTAQEIRWLGQQEMFYGSGDVLVTKEDTVMSGDNIESDKALEKIKITGHAKIVKGGASK